MTNDLRQTETSYGAIDNREATPMLDPTWTPAAGYSHTLRLLQMLNAERGVGVPHQTRGALRDEAAPPGR